MMYKIIEEFYSDDLERKVNEAIKQGWKPIGGVCVISYDIRLSMYQAMIFGGKE